MRVTIAIFLWMLMLSCNRALAASAEVVYERAAPSVVFVVGIGTTSSMQGSGVIVATNIVATNCHVVKSASAIAVLSGSKKSSAAVMYADADRDVCLLSVNITGGAPVKLGSGSSIKVGQRVYAIGAPRGLALSLSEGIVSSLRGQNGSRFIQTTAQISPGSSGGGLFDEQGRLIGLTTFRIKESEGLNFSLPVEWVSEAIAQGLRRKSSHSGAAASGTEFPSSALPMVTATSLSGGRCPFDVPPPIQWKSDVLKMNFEKWARQMNQEIVEAVAKSGNPYIGQIGVKEGSGSDPARSLFYEALRAGIDPNLAVALAIKLVSRNGSTSEVRSNMALPISQWTIEAMKVAIISARPTFCWDPYAFRTNARLAMTSLRGYLDERNGDAFGAISAYGMIDAEMKRDKAQAFTDEVGIIWARINGQLPAPSM